MTKEKQRYEISQVPTQTELVIVDKDNDKQYQIMEFLAQIGNDINEIKKSLIQ